MEVKPEIIFTVLEHENSKFTPLGPKGMCKLPHLEGSLCLKYLGGELVSGMLPELFLFGTGALLSTPAQPQASFLTTGHFW